jgi:hypothetical protein
MTLSQNKPQRRKAKSPPWSAVSSSECLDTLVGICGISGLNLLVKPTLLTEVILRVSMKIPKAVLKKIKKKSHAFFAAIL